MARHTCYGDRKLTVQGQERRGQHTTGGVRDVNRLYDDEGILLLSISKYGQINYYKNLVPFAHL